MTQPPRIPPSKAERYYLNRAMTDATILLVEDEDHIASLVQLYLKNDGYTVEHVADGVSALAAADRLQPALVVLPARAPAPAKHA